MLPGEFRISEPQKRYFWSLWQTFSYFEVYLVAIFLSWPEQVFFFFNERALFVSGFALMTFHLSETGGPGALIPREKLDFQNLRIAILAHSGRKFVQLKRSLIASKADQHSCGIFEDILPSPFSSCFFHLPDFLLPFSLLPIAFLAVSFSSLNRSSPLVITVKWQLSR